MALKDIIKKTAHSVEKAKKDYSAYQKKKAVQDKIKFNARIDKEKRRLVLEKINLERQKVRQSKQKMIAEGQKRQQEAFRKLENWKP